MADQTLAVQHPLVVDHRFRWRSESVMMTVMNLQQLRCLVALADERNFTRAAG